MIKKKQKNSKTIFKREVETNKKQRSVWQRRRMTVKLSQYKLET